MHVPISMLCGVLATAGLMARAEPAGTEATAAPAPAPAPPAVRRVAEFTLSTTNGIQCGTNLLSVAAFTNQADDILGEDVEAVVIHGGLATTSVLRLPPELLEYLLRTGKSVFVDTREEAATPGDAAMDENIRTITLKTSYLRILDGRSQAAKDDYGGVVGGVSLGSTFDVDTARGTYELREVGLGLWDDRFWLVHGLPAADADEDDAGSIGVQFQKEW